ncbi:threonine synthase [Campylobacter mucosalis]|uniref:threonine synthase n=1 Tax=Campylobacter mucosalis TaxID=202 RepID=UPI0004DACDE6|nr:threonine synthase [Campylobacter mucosalis]KEA46632.1 threonine synthase [Campylobacter mucosalis]QKF62852.1 threonine synthase [Campylobacter mucosalis]
MRLNPTRLDKNEKPKQVGLKKALLSPSSNHGGLYAPIKLPKITDKKWQELSLLSYEKIALYVISLFKFDVDEKIFKSAIKRYKNFDKPNEPVQFKKLSKNLYINELFHGPTRAFKDMALQPFGEILSLLAQEQKQNYLIMCATSGDTGPATLKTFANSKNIKALCLYPANGTSEVQRLQMVCMQGENLKTIGINGNFDDAQRALKTLLSSQNFKSELSKSKFNLSAANSVNFGRILFQIIYHIYAYLRLLKLGLINKNETFDIIVPSGNFGNALGAYYAKKMGVKIGKIKIVSNANNILTELFTTGIYDLRGKKLVKTISPAMDILISSNIERLLFDKFGAVRTKELMDALSKDKFYKLTKDELSLLQDDFVADFCTDSECEKFIKEWADKKIAIDPHTATCLKMVDDKKINIITSTAHWVKFAPSMLKACGIDAKNEKDGLLKFAKNINEVVPESILELFDAKILHPEVTNQEQIEAKILDWIKK